jgi:hypothetical protein
MPEYMQDDGRRPYMLVLISYCLVGLWAQVNIVDSHAGMALIQIFSLNLMRKIKKKLQPCGEEELAANR